MPWAGGQIREREGERDRETLYEKIAETPESRSIARNMGGGSSSNPAPAAPHKKGKVALQSAGVAPPPPKCQVEGCGMDLTGTKAYYCRHKVCSTHSKSPKVIVSGKEQRFCQQCSRFHQLNEFDQGKRSCRRRLAGHNERRRKPPPGLLSSHYGRLSSLREYGSGYQCFVMDFTSPNPPTNAKQTWPTIRVGGQVTCSQGEVPLSIPTASRVATQDVNTNSTYRQGSVGKVVFPDPCLDPNRSLVVADSSCALSLLSSQPLATLNSTSQFPVLPENSSQGAHTQMSEPSMLSSLVDSCNAHAIPYDMGLGQPAETEYGQFSAHFEPAPCVKSQYTDSGYERTYGSSSNLMHSGLYKPGCSFPLD